MIEIIGVVTKKEKSIINDRIYYSKLSEHILKVVVINDFVETYTEEYYPDLIIEGNEQENSCGICITYNKINKCDILISSDKFMSNIEDIYPYLFDNIFCHELGHVNHKHHHVFDKMLKSLDLPEYNEEEDLFSMKDIAHEIYANSFRDALLENKKIIQKEIVNDAIYKILDLKEEYYHICNLGGIPTYWYTPEGFSIVSEDE